MPHNRRLLLPLATLLLTLAPACRHDTVSPLSRTRRSLADGVPRQDSLTWLQANHKAAHRVPATSPPQFSAAPDTTSTYCGASMWTIPSSVNLLAADVASGAFITDRMQDPVGHAFNLGRGPCALQLAVSPEWQLYQSGLPASLQEQPVEIALSGDVAAVVVYGDGALSCTSDGQGAVIAFGANGAEVARAQLRLRDPADCGEDNITYGVWASLSARPAGIRRLVIQGPAPWTFRSDFAEGGVAYAQQQYTLILTLPPAGPVVDVKPARDTIVPSVSHYEFNPKTRKYKFTYADTSRVSVRLLVTDGVSGKPVPNAAIHLQLIAHDSTGGHVHVGGKPTGSLSRADVVSDAAGGASVVFYAPEAAGPVTIRATVAASEDTASVNVMIRNLVSMPPSASYHFTGARAGFHVDNHYASTDMRASLAAFADSLRRRWGEVLGINDISLVFGGLFEADTAGPWKIPHASHRLGTGADIRSIYWDTARTRQAVEVWDSCFGHAVFEGNHLHLNQTHKC